MKEEIINKKLLSLSKSKFRSGFKLKKSDIDYINKIGFDKLLDHTYDFVRTRLTCNNPLDGKQTPMKGHPVFIAQHATATCCRGCIYKWHKIPQNRELTENEINFIVSLIITWIQREYYK